MSNFVKDVLILYTNSTRDLQETHNYVNFRLYSLLEISVSYQTYLLLYS